MPMQNAYDVVELKTDDTIYFVIYHVADDYLVVRPFDPFELEPYSSYLQVEKSDFLRCHNLLTRRLHQKFKDEHIYLCSSKWKCPARYKWKRDTGDLHKKGRI